MLFTEEIAGPPIGWNTFFLCYGEDENGVWGADVLRYLPYDGGDSGGCAYALSTYAGGQQRSLGGNSILLALTADVAAKNPDIDWATGALLADFRAETASLLGDAELLFSDDPAVCAGIADISDWRGTKRAAENILAELDELAVRLCAPTG